MRNGENGSVHAGLVWPLSCAAAAAAAEIAQQTRMTRMQFRFDMNSPHFRVILAARTEHVDNYLSRPLHRFTSSPEIASGLRIRYRRGL